MYRTVHFCGLGVQGKASKLACQRVKGRTQIVSTTGTDNLKRKFLSLSLNFLNRKIQNILVENKVHYKQDKKNIGVTKYR